MTSQTADMPQETPTLEEGEHDIVVVQAGNAWHERLSRWILSGLGEAVAMCLGLAFVVFGAGALTVERGEADLAAAVPNIERAFAEAFDGQRADIGELKLRPRPAEGRLILSGRDIRVDGERQELANLSRLEAEFDYAAAIARRAELTSLEADGAVATLRRRNGRWRAGLGRPETLGQLGPVVPIRMGGAPSAALPRVELENTTLHLLDEDLGLNVRLDGASLRFADGEMSLDGTIGEEMGGGSVSLRLPGAEGQRLSGRVEGARLAALVGESEALSAVRGIAFPMTGDLGLSRKGDIGFDLAADSAGSLGLGERQVAVEALKLWGTVDPDARSGDVGLEMESDVLTTSGAVDARLEEGRVYGRIDLGRTRLRVDALPEPQLRLSEVSGSYAYDLARRDVELRGLDTRLKGVRFRGDLGLRLGDDGPEEATARLNMEGDLTPEALMSLWPEEFVGGARRWIERAVLGGRISNLVVVADLPRAALQGGEVMIDGELNRRPIPDDALLMTFDVEEGRVRYISTMTPLENASGSGELRGNSFTFDLTAGSVGPLGVRSARVEMPLLVPKGGPMTITVEGEGEAEPMLRLIDEEPFRFASAYGLDPAQFGGRGEVAMTITRPIREFITPDQVSYSVEGRFRDASVPFSLFGQPLTDGDLTLRADARRLYMEGPVSFGPWRADLTYDDTLGDFGAAPTRATLKGDVSRDALDSFGIGLRRFFDGDVPVEVEALTNGLQLLSADVVADLTDSNLTLDPYWAKPKGIPARLTLDASREGEVTVVEDIVLTAPGAEIRADLIVQVDGKLERLEVEQATIRDVLDLSAVVTPNADRSRLEVAVEGDFIDLSPAVAERLQNPADGSGLPVDLKGTFDRLLIAEDYALDSAEVMFASDGDGIERARLAGKHEGRDAVAAITPSETGRELTLRLPDASGAAAALFGWEGIRGGEMRLDAGLPPVGEPGALLGEVEIDDITLERAPILAQLLSLASLTGLGDTLSGQGLRFRKVRGEFGYRDGVLSLRDTRASGPALGITVEGEVGLGAKLLDLNGVLVPAYTANSLLGDVPLIGDLLVGDKGEGIVSLGYTVQGPYAATQIAVNPLSALTPGVLRDVFEPQREELEEMMEEGEE